MESLIIPISIIDLFGLLYHYISLSIALKRIDKTLERWDKTLSDYAVKIEQTHNLTERNWAKLTEINILLKKIESSRKNDKST